MEEVEKEEEVDREAGEVGIQGNIMETSHIFLTVRPHLPVQEMQVQSLGQEDPPEKEMATHSSILAWRIPSTEKPGVQSTVLQRVGHDITTNQ